MAGLGRQFLTINGNALHETSGFTIDTKTVEKTFMSEDGYDKSILIRTGKHVFSPSWTGATSAHKALCETFCSLPTVTLVFDMLSNAIKISPDATITSTMLITIATGRVRPFLLFFENFSIIGQKLSFPPKNHLNTTAAS